MPRQLLLPSRRKFLLLAALLTAVLPAARIAAQPSCLAPEQAQAHVGERTCVEGVVTGAVFAQRSTGQPTFLDLGPQFTAVIWSEDRPKFNPPPERLRGRRVRVVGRIELYRGKAQIVVHEPEQLTPADAAAPSVETTAGAATPAAFVPTEQARVWGTAPALAAPAQPAADPMEAEPRVGRSTPPLLAAGAGLLALGGALAAWHRWRRPPAG
ncbi:MAG: hypothetical protein C4290_12835 [Chloroflexota bacterium]